jgi:hypothetical protein
VASRMAEVRDAAAAVIRAGWNPSLPDAVSGVWVKDVRLDPEHADVLAGRQVFVIAGGLERVEVYDRDAQLRRHTVGVLVCERYADAAGDVPDEWIDARVAFVEGEVFARLSAPELDLTGDGTVRIAFDVPAAIDLPCDRDLLRSKRCFWSVCTFTFQELV